MRSKLRLQRVFLLTGIVVTFFTLNACSGEDVNPFSSNFGRTKRVDKKAPEKIEEEASVEDGGNNTGRVTKGIEGTGAGFQVKDVALLRSSINSCMGEGRLTITDDMLIPVGQNSLSVPDLPDGRYRFLLGNSYEAGEDIIEKERGNLVDYSQGNRTAITSDSLTDTYLRSLETIANVVAHSCDGSNEMCKCGTKDEAKVLLERCLPGIDPNSEKMDFASLIVSEECAEGEVGVRRAIASLLSSYAFAAAR